MDDTPHADLRGARRGADAAARCRPDAGGTGPSGDGAAVGGGLESAPDCRPSGVQPGDGPPAADAGPRARRGQPPAAPARTTARHGAPRADRGGAGRPARPGPHLDGGPTRRRAGRGRHPLEHPPDAQVSGADRRLAAHGADAPAQAGPGEGRAGEAGAHLAQKKPPPDGSGSSTWTNAASAPASR